MTPRALRAAALAAAFAASPALADHPAPSGIGGAGATLNLLSPDTLGRGQASVGAQLTLARPDRRSDDELEALAAHHVHAHDADYRLGVAIGGAYGVTDRLTLSVELPFVHHDDLRAGDHSHVAGHSINEVVELGSVSGVADPSLLAKYKLLDSAGTRIALVGGMKFPFGDTDRKSHDGHRLDTEHQPGSGSWDPLIGAAFGTRVGPFDLIASGLYQFAGKGAQQTRLGDRAKGGIALSRRFARSGGHHAAPAGKPHDGPHHGAQGGQHGHHADHHAEHHAEHHGRPQDPPPHPYSSWDGFVELTGEWEGRQKIDGKTQANSGGTSVWLSPGVRFNAAAGYSIAAGIGIPVWQDIRASHPDNGYRLALTLGRAF